jgi:hypothetical protein
MAAVGLGVAIATGPRIASAPDTEGPQPVSTYGVMPGGGISNSDAARSGRRGG